MKTTDEVIQEMRRRVLNREIGDAEVAQFYEAMQTALADSLYHVADPYHLVEDIAKASQMACRRTSEMLN